MATSERERIIQIFFFGFLAVMAYELYILLEPFLTPIAWAILLAFVMHPLLVHLDRWVRRRTLSAVILTLAVALGVILPAVWLSGRLASEAQLLTRKPPRRWTREESARRTTGWSIPNGLPRSIAGLQAASRSKTKLPSTRCRLPRRPASMWQRTPPAWRRMRSRRWSTSASSCSSSSTCCATARVTTKPCAT